MCGRFTLRSPTAVLARRLRAEVKIKRNPRFNIAPTQSVLVILANDANQKEAPAREAKTMNWGLVPSWAKDPSSAARLINCRSETAATKPSFRSAFQSRRCLVIADGYYEWERAGKQKLPWHIHRTDEQPFAMAGLWETWQPDKASSPLLSCTVLTTNSNKRTAFLHERMPVILSSDDEEVWLDHKLQTHEQLEHLFEPFPSADIDLRPVSTHVNNARHEGDNCLEPRATQGELF